MSRTKTRTAWMLRNEGATPGGRTDAAGEGVSRAMTAIIGPRSPARRTLARARGGHAVLHEHPRSLAPPRLDEQPFELGAGDPGQAHEDGDATDVLLVGHGTPQYAPGARRERAAGGSKEPLLAAWRPGSGGCRKPP